MITGPRRVHSNDDHRLDDFRSLNDQSYRRTFEGDELFIAEGFVAVDRLIESGHDIRSVLLAPSRVQRFSEHFDELARRGVEVIEADPTVIADVVGFDLHRGVIAAATRRPTAQLPDIAAHSHRLAVLVGLNDAENLGAIARAARALGIDALVIDARCTDPYSRRSVRVSMGEILMLPVVRAQPDAIPMTLATLREWGFETWAMTPGATAANIWDLTIPKKLAVVFGAEGPGLDRRTMSAAARRVRIPLTQGIDSLNVGHAAAITFAAINR